MISSAISEKAAGYKENYEMNFDDDNSCKAVAKHAETNSV